MIKTIYPAQCVMCDALTQDDFGLCGACWAQTPFITGLCCDDCGAPLPGQGTADPSLLCDDCMTVARPWSRGRSALVYKDFARRLVLALKHGDRTDLVRAAGPWLARAGQDLMGNDAIIVPVPLHRFRLLRRRFNQAALLAQQVARIHNLAFVPDALVRTKQTSALEGHSRDQRFAALDKAITVHPKRKQHIEGQNIVLVDDVMTSGATFASATEACYAAGAKDVCVLALARVVKDA